jgi:hypothetical protein
LFGQLPEPPFPLNWNGGFVFRTGWLQVDSIDDPKSGLPGFNMLSGTEVGVDGQIDIQWIFASARLLRLRSGPRRITRLRRNST